jgi:tetratricopeptide (TPR) repeat protein
VSFDYAFENNPLDAVHRLGVSFEFGQTILESRRLALERADAAFEHRMAALFEQRQQERVESLLELTRSRLAEGDYANALRLVGSVLVLDAGNAAARDLETQALLAQAAELERSERHYEATLVYQRVLNQDPDNVTAREGEQRTRAASDAHAQRDEWHRERFTAAIQAFGAEDFDVARDALDEILARNPDDQDAVALRERATNAIQRRARSWVELARTLVESGSLDEARTLLRRALEEDASVEGARALQSEIRARVAAAEAEAARETEDTAPRETLDASLSSAPTPRVPEVNAQELEELYQRGVDAMQEGRSEDAVRYWELVWSADPKHARVQQRLGREYLMRGMEYFANGDIDEATRLWQQALRVDPDDARAVGYLARAQELKTRTRELLGEGR